MSPMPRPCCGISCRGAGNGYAGSRSAHDEFTNGTPNDSASRRDGMGHVDVEQILVVRDVVLELLPLDLLHGAAVVVVGDEVPRRQADLPFAGSRIRVGVRAKHGRVVSD